MQDPLVLQQCQTAEQLLQDALELQAGHQWPSRKIQRRLGGGGGTWACRICYAGDREAGLFISLPGRLSTGCISMLHACCLREPLHDWHSTCSPLRPKPHLRNGEMPSVQVDALQQPGHVMLHVVKHHIDAALVIVALVACKSGAFLECGAAGGVTSTAFGTVRPPCWALPWRPVQPSQ